LRDREASLLSQVLSFSAKASSLLGLTRFA